MQYSTATTIVDQLYEEHQSLVQHLAAAREVSLQNNVDNNFRKTLLVAAASYIEAVVSDIIPALFSDGTAATEPLVEFVRNKAIARQYHTLFNWDRRNANTFFGFFGGNFREYMTGQVSKDPSLDGSIKAFLELGELRNELVHQNFAIFPLEKIVAEIYGLYKDAMLFVEAIPNKIREYIVYSQAAG